MGRQIYKRSVAPHQARVASDGGVPTDAVNDAILLAIDNQEFEGKDKCLIYSPELTGNKLRVNGIYTHATKGYSANSPQRELGDDKCINGGFDTDTTWGKGAGWTISDGVAKANNAISASIYQGMTDYAENRFYYVEFEIKNYVSGTLTAYVGGNGNGTTRNANGIYREIIQAKSAVSNFYLSPVNATLEVDNVKYYPANYQDLLQTTANSQPYLGKINPSEPQCLQNQNGDVRFMSHPAISFAANEKWTVEWCSNSNGSPNGYHNFLKNDSPVFWLGQTNSGAFSIRTPNEIKDTVQRFRGYGKYSIYHATHNAGVISFYGDGNLIATTTITTGVTISNILQGYGVDRQWFGKTVELAIIPDALSADRIAYRSALLRSIFPEIPTVRIAGMDVACRALDVVCTPAGTLIPNVTVNGDWAALSTAAWAHHGNDVALGTVYGKAYNGYARTTLVTDLASSGFGYHVATKEELTTLMESGLAIKAMGTNYWTTANGTNITGATLLGGASRNTDGTFATIKGSVMFWCADVDECLTLLDNGTISIDAKDLKTGAYILLVKDYTGEFVYDSLGEQIFDVNGVPWISV